jgi:hypothetical protein
MDSNVRCGQERKCRWTEAAARVLAEANEDVGWQVDSEVPLGLWERLKRVLGRKGRN